MSRTNYKFNSHTLFVKECEEFSQFRLVKVKDNKELIEGSVIFTCIENGLLVTGDFGQWFFDRNFNPKHNTTVSDGYWVEKLPSNITYKQFSCDETNLAIDEFEANLAEMYGEEKVEELQSWLENLRYASDDEVEYIYEAYRNNPSFVEYENVPIGYEINRYLLIIFDAFEEVAKRLQENKIM